MIEVRLLEPYWAIGASMSYRTTAVTGLDYVRTGSCAHASRTRCCHWLHGSLAFQPPHSANRHDAGCRGAGADRLAARQ